MVNKKYKIITLLLLLSLPGCNKEETAFIEALKSSDWQEAQEYLTRHPDYVNKRNPKTGATLLHSAVYYDNTEMVEFLLKNGADYNILRSKDLRWTPLQAAAAMSRYEIVLIFLQKGANPNFRDESLRTSLHYAAESSTPEMIELLLSWGADIDAKTDSGQTPLCYAGIKRNEDETALAVMRTLLDDGADPNALCLLEKPVINSVLIIGYDYFKKAQLLEDYGVQLKLQTNQGVKAYTVEEYYQIYKENEEYIEQEIENRGGVIF